MLFYRKLHLPITLFRWNYDNKTLPLWAKFVQFYWNGSALTCHSEPFIVDTNYGQRRPRCPINCPENDEMGFYFHEMFKRRVLQTWKYWQYHFRNPWLQSLPAYRQACQCSLMSNTGVSSQTPPSSEKMSRHSHFNNIAQPLLTKVLLSWFHLNNVGLQVD